MAKRKKYQFGDPNYPQAQMKDFSGNLPNKDILHFLLTQQGQNVVNQYKNAGYSIKANDNDVVASRPVGDYKLPAPVQAFNTLAQLTTGVANRVNDIKSGQNEYKQYIEALQPIISENYNEQGLNNLPTYTKYGGGKWIQGAHLEKGRCTPGSPNYDCPPGSPQYNLAQTFKKHHGFHEAQYGGECQDGCGEVDHDMIHEMMKAGGWIKGAIKHPGRCSNPGDSRCPKGSPQYNLAMRFKHGDLHKHQTGGSVPRMTTEQMAQFNRFNDYVRGQGYGESDKLNNQQFSRNLYSQFTKANPDVVLPYEQMIPMAQQEQYYLKNDATDFANRHNDTNASNIMHNITPFDSMYGPKTSTYNFPTATVNTMSPTNKLLTTQELGLVRGTGSGLQTGSGKYSIPKGSKLETLVDSSGTSGQYYENQSGDIVKYPYGGGPLTADGAKEILRDGTVHGKKLTPAQRRYFGYIAGGGTPKSQYGSNLQDVRKITDSPFNSDYDQYPVNTTRVDARDKFLNNTKSISDFYNVNPLTSADNILSPKQTFPLRQWRAEHLFDINNYKGTAAQNLQLLKAEREAWNEVPTNQFGGSQMPAVEAEQGEAYQTPQGQVNKVPDSAPTHEDGGVVLNNAERVLENTSNLRKDKKSKQLLLSPQLASLLTGTDIKSSVSHAGAMDKAQEGINNKQKALNKKIEKNVDVIESNPHDFYANNSLDFNLLNMKGLGNSAQIFDTLFQHQEMVKQAHGIENPEVKAQVGIDNASRLHDTEGWQFLYNRGDKSYYRKPDGSVVASNGPKMSDDQWRQFLQSESPAHKAERLARQQQGYQYGYTVQANPGIDIQHPTAQMANMSPNFQFPNVDIPDQTTITNNIPGNRLQVNRNAKSQFNEPLHWYDVAGPIMGLTEGRIPVRYNGADLNQIRLKLQNPLPSLQQGQRDFNDIVAQLPQNSQGYSNASDLFSRKYNIDNQLLGQYENTNANIKNQETMYNAGVKDRQSLINQQARGIAEDQRLGSLEAQRLQRRTDWDSLFNTFAQNHALNRNGNLVMQLFPAFDQNAQYNGYQVPFRRPLDFPNQIGDNGLPANTSIITNTSTSGKPRYFVKNPDGSLKEIKFKN